MSSAVWRVAVNEWIGLPAVIRSKRAQSSGAEAASSRSFARLRPRMPGPLPQCPAAAVRVVLEEEIGEVGSREEPRLRAEQAGDGQQRQDRRAGPRAPGLEQEGGQHQGDVGKVDEGPQPVGEEGRPGEDDRRREDDDRPVEPVRAQAVDEVDDRGQGQIGDHGRRRGGPGPLQRRDDDAPGVGE
jgi:hypothetical protein